MHTVVEVLGADGITVTMELGSFVDSDRLTKHRSMLKKAPSERAHSSMRSARLFGHADRSTDGLAVCRREPTRDPDPARQRDLPHALWARLVTAAAILHGRYRAPPAADN